MVIGHEKQLKMFQTFITNDALAHAYLFTGPWGIGKHAFALELANKLQEHKDTSMHPDILNFSEPPTIKQVRELKRQIAISPFMGKQKIVIINNVDKIQNEAANALLKILEEPRGDNIFILISQHLSVVLDTIRSRCYKIKFSYVPDEIIEKELNVNKISISNWKNLKLHWTGRPQVAMRLLNDEVYLKKIMEYKKDCDMFINGSLSDRFNISEKYAKIENISSGHASEVSEILRIWAEHIRNMNLDNKTELISGILNVYKISTTTNANIKFLFNNFALKV